MSDATKLAIDALQAINPAFICDNAHHAKKDQHGYASECPIVARHEAALAALRAQPDHSEQHLEMVAAARAVVERWDTPLWKDAPATAGFINRLRDALPPVIEGKL